MRLSVYNEEVPFSQSTEPGDKALNDSTQSPAYNRSYQLAPAKTMDEFTLAAKSGRQYNIEPREKLQSNLEQRDIKYVEPERPIVQRR